MPYMNEDESTEILRPAPNPRPDFTEVMKVCEQHMTEISGIDPNPDSEDDHYIYEEVMKAIYGENVFDYINSRR